MTVYVVGRSDRGSVISVGSEHANVSRRHLEFSLLDDDRVRIVDLNTANGTEVLTDGRWERIAKAVISKDHKLRLAREYETTVRELLRLDEERRRRPGQETHSAVEAMPASEILPPQSPGNGQHAPSPSMLAHMVTCETCGRPASGEYCRNCGQRLISDAKNIVGVIAEDLFNVGERQGLAQRLLLLAVSPVRATLALAEDPHFKLHGAMFALASVLYVFWLRVLGALVEGPARKAPGFCGTLPPGRLKGGCNFFSEIFPWETLIAIGIYVTFVLSFVISYYVFIDYSKKPKSARSYLKLCCIGSLVGIVAFILLTSPILLSKLKIMPAKFLGWLFLLFCLIYITFILYYSVQTTTRFWSISSVSAFRGICVAMMLAVFATFIITICLGLLVSLFVLPFT